MNFTLPTEMSPSRIPTLPSPTPATHQASMLPGSPLDAPSLSDAAFDEVVLAVGKYSQTRSAETPQTSALEQWASAPFVASANSTPPPAEKQAFSSPDPTLENLLALVADLAVVDPSEITQASAFADLGLDSLDHARVVSDCDEMFEIELPETAHATTTVDALYQLILAAQDAQAAA